MKLSHIRLNRYTLLITVCALVLGSALGYYLGYDHGWERGVGYLQSGTQ